MDHVILSADGTAEELKKVAASDGSAEAKHQKAITLVLDWLDVWWPDISEAYKEAIENIENPTQRGKTRVFVPPWPAKVSRPPPPPPPL